jgi:hypothetical protein
VLFGLRIPHLPDLMASPHLAGANEREKLVEIRQRQVAFITSLGKWKQAAFSVRFIRRPTMGDVEIFILAMGLGPAKAGRDLGAQIAGDISQLLRSLDYPVETITSEAALVSALDPVPNAFIAEVRQREELASMIRGTAYVVYPYRQSPLATWLNLFQVLASQNEPCALNVHLQPTHLHDHESKFFSAAAQFAASLSEENFQGLITQVHLSDPVARGVAALYTDYLRRLREPYLLTAQAVAHDPHVARNLAQILAAELTEIHALDESGVDESHLPSGFDLAIPQSEADLNAARQTLTTLDFALWGRTEANESQVRLRFLVDAKTASAAFRFPVALRGGVPGIKTRQVMPSHDVGPRVGTVGPGEISLGTFADRGGVAGVPIKLFTRHTLVAGTNGSGKTTTCMQILSQLWETGIPFLVIEPAKTEYRTLLDSPLGNSLQIFTLGDESVSPFRLNPLEIQPGIRVETHISAIRACFEAALPTFGILPSLIEESLHNVYQDKGWNLTDRGRVDDARLMPTLGELYFEIIRATEERGYSEKTLQDIRAAAAGRIGSLLRGSKGRMLNNRRSIPMKTLMTRPTVLELESLNDDEKALVMLFLLTMIREYCRANREDSRLQHVTLIEEAHRVMSAMPHAADRETSADTRAQAVEMFSASLSEVRAFGEGLIIAEQIPGRLAEDALKNTNIKIVHRLPGQDDRQTVGATMNLSEEQEPYLAKLVPGQAALFIEGYERPTFIYVPDYRAQHQLPDRIGEERLEMHKDAFLEPHRALLLPFDGCRYCQRQCRYRDRVAPVAYEVESGKRFRKALWTFEKKRNQGDETAGWVELVKTCQEVVGPIGLRGDEHAVYCYFVHLWGYEFTEAMASQFRATAKDK